VSLPEWFIKLLTREDEIVIDPFIGSGTTALACIKLNRHYLGIELQEKYYNLALKATKGAQLKLPMTLAASG